MNKRMREPFNVLTEKASIVYNVSWSQIDPEVLEKFAELIVSECAKIADDNYNNGFAPVGGDIRKHFGVK